jgi:hypothetical protein
MQAAAALKTTLPAALAWIGLDIMRLTVENKPFWHPHKQTEIAAKAMAEGFTNTRHRQHVLGDRSRCVQLLEEHQDTSARWRQWDGTGS